MPRVGLLGINTEGNSDDYVGAFRDGLRSLGYEEGKNVQLDHRFLVADYQGLPQAAARLVAEKVDLIFCYGTTATLAAAKATSTIPIVMIAGDPVKSGLAASLSKPGKNITGISLIGFDLSEKRLELLRNLRPEIRRIAVLFNPNSPGEIVTLRSYESAAQTLKLGIRRVEIRSREEIALNIAAIDRTDVQALAVIGASLFVANTKQVVAAIEKLRLPALYTNRGFVDAGGLVAYGPDLIQDFHRAAFYVDKILKGAKPGELPIEQPTRLHLTVNQKTAKAIGLTIPREILLRADEVIDR
jgi:ABC-type uncharacterized transport system substrate-binding protein